MAILPNIDIIVINQGIDACQSIESLTHSKHLQVKSSFFRTFYFLLTFYKTLDVTIFAQRVVFFPSNERWQNYKLSRSRYDRGEQKNALFRFLFEFNFFLPALFMCGTYEQRWTLYMCENSMHRICWQIIWIHKLAESIEKKENKDSIALLQSVCFAFFSVFHCNRITIRSILFLNWLSI